MRCAKKVPVEAIVRAGKHGLGGLLRLGIRAVIGTTMSVDLALIQVEIVVRSTANYPPTLTRDLRGGGSCRRLLVDFQKVGESRM